MARKSLVCDVCGEGSFSFFISVGTKIICYNCRKSGKKKAPAQFEIPRTFKRYVCLTHKCGTYNIQNMFGRHEMKNCVIREQITLGIVRPATYGGKNGDISKKYFLKNNVLDGLKHQLVNYNKFNFIRMKIMFPLGDRVRVGYNEKRYYEKHIHFLKTSSNNNTIFIAEVMKRIQGRYDVYLKELSEKRQQRIDNKIIYENRKKKSQDDYYASLMVSHNKQVNK